MKPIVFTILFVSTAFSMSLFLAVAGDAHARLADEYVLLRSAVGSDAYREQFPAGGGPLEVRSQYEEAISIPEYDENDRSHLLITEGNGNWRASVLNNPEKRHFYVAPGSYPEIIALTVSGAAGDRRTLSLYNGNDRHPAMLDTSAVADIRIALDDASYWVFDRIASLHTISLNQAIWIGNGSSHNVFNRILLDNFNNGLYIYGGGDGNVIQNSQFRNMNIYAPDGVALGLTWGENKETFYSIKNTRIINNEFYNCNDAIQLVRRNRPSDGELQSVDYEGTVIDNNIMYIDSSIYTDGNGNLSSDGAHALAENGIDVKAGSDNPGNPVLISNNKIWGYRKSDNLPGGTRSDHGAAVVFHFGAKNIAMKNNLIFDSAQGIVSGVRDRFGFALGNAVISDNIFLGIGAFDGTGSNYGGIMLWDAYDVLFRRNTVVKARVRSLWTKASVSDVSVVESVVIDSESPFNESPASSIFNGNYYYNTPAAGYASGANDHSFTTAAEAGMGSYTFVYDKFTRSPKTRTLQGVIATKDSPHQDLAGSRIAVTDPIFSNDFE